jgi:hypothetical protein
MLHNLERATTRVNECSFEGEAEGDKTYEVKVLLVFEQIDESNDSLVSNTPEYESLHRYKLGS